LGLSLYKLAKDKISNLILADISEEALDLAKENKNLIVGEVENIYFYKSDLLLDIPQKFLEKNFIIVANLPYIPDDIFFENVEDNVKKWEPSIAFL
jgi:methylase of polypeptide subunit release factors